MVDAEALLDPAFKLSKELHLDEGFSASEERRDDRRGLAPLSRSGSHGRCGSGQMAAEFRKKCYHARTYPIDSHSLARVCCDSGQYLKL